MRATESTNDEIVIEADTFTLVVRDGGLKASIEFTSKIDEYFIRENIENTNQKQIQIQTNAMNHKFTHKCESLKAYIFDGEKSLCSECGEELKIETK